MTRVPLLGIGVDAVDLGEATARVLDLAGQSTYVCAANAHMAMEAHDDPAVTAAVNGAALVVPDGMSLARRMRHVAPGQQRIAGPDLMLDVCRAAAQSGVPVGLYGSTATTLKALVANLHRMAPGLRIAIAHAPPFRPLSPAEEAAEDEILVASGTKILFVGLGCPKQELWMARRSARLPMVLLGVGGAFDMHAGRVRRAPGWVSRVGLEWLYRFLQEPRRLARRQLQHLRFLWHARRRPRG